MAVRVSAPRLRVTLREGPRSFTLIADGLSLPAGQMLAITGESGSGKTLLLEALGLLRRPDPGSDYRIEGPGASVSLSGAWDGPDPQRDLARLRREYLGFVPQSGGLLAFLDVGRNISLAQDLSGKPDPDYLTYLSGALGLAKLRHRMPDGLSIGERQRVAIARALAHRPLVVIADEPTAALDPYLSKEVMDLFLRLAAEQNTTVLVSTHNVDLVQALGLPQLRMRSEALIHPDGSEPTDIVSTLGPVAATEPA